VLVGAQLPREHPLHRDFIQYYRDIGLPEDFYWFALNTAPPDAIHWMTPDELDRFFHATVAKISPPRDNG